MSEHQLWYDKYRPKQLDEYVWPTNNLKELVESWIKQRSIPSVMFAGGPGRGKTSLAELIIHASGIDEADVLRLKGAKDNSAETIRTRVQEFCELGGWSGLRLVFFDEADLLSRTAQEMLRNVIDDYSESVRFIFTCNYPHRIIEALSTSRLLRIEIDTLDREPFLDRLASIVQTEQLDLDDDACRVLEEIMETCYPDLRRAINFLQSSVRDGKLRLSHGVKPAAGIWESCLRELLTTQVDPIREICRIREMLAMLSPDEMEDVYRFLYQNGATFFGDKQIGAIFIINNGQKVHRAALLPEMILLEVIVRLMALSKNG